MQCGQSWCITFLWSTCSPPRISSVCEWCTHHPVTQATDLRGVLNAFLSFTQCPIHHPVHLIFIYWMSFQSVHFCSRSLTPSRPSFFFFFFWFLILTAAVASYLHSGCNWFCTLHAEASFQDAKLMVLSPLVLVCGSLLLEQERCVLITGLKELQDLSPRLTLHRAHHFSPPMLAVSL